MSIDARNELLARWMSALESQRLLMGRREAVESELSHWLELMALANEGREEHRKELYRLVAMHSRGLGLEGRPASAAVMQLLTLMELVSGSTLDPTVLELTRIAADAHALGREESIRQTERQTLRRVSPIVRIAPHTLCGFLLGEMSRESLDSLFGRLLRQCSAERPQVVAVDVAGAESPDDRFHRTVFAFLQSPPAAGVRLVLTGLLDSEPTRETLLALGIPASRLQFHARLDDWLEQLG